jgi:hypothetical protein
VNYTNNVSVFAERYIKINTPSSGLVEIKLNDFQKRVIAKYKSEKIFHEIWDRQSGKTTVASIILLHQSLFNANKYNAIFAMKPYIGYDIIREIYDMYQRLPEHMKITRGSMVKKDEITFDNGSVIKTLGKNLEGARGLYFDNIYLDESRYINDVHRHYDRLITSLRPGENSRFFELSS